MQLQIQSVQNYEGYVMDFIKKENATLNSYLNADETALYYKYVPKHTYDVASEQSPSSGLKECKQRMTLLS